MNISHPEEPTPLTPHAFHVLLALAKGQDSGYGITATVREDTHDTIDIASGTLYPMLNRLTHSGYVLPLEPQAGSGPHGVNRAYRITDNGRTVLGWELNRYAEAVRLGSVRVQ